MVSYAILLCLSFFQSIAHTMSSRSRNRDKMWYHAACAVFSNGIFFMSLNILVKSNMNWNLAIPYIIGTVTGSLFGAKVSMRIERLIGAKT